MSYFNWLIDFQLYPTVWIIILSIVVALVTKILLPRRFGPAVMFLLVAWYLGPISSIKILLFLLAISVINSVFIRHWFVSLFIVIQGHIILGLITNPIVSLILILLFSLFILFRWHGSTYVLADLQSFGQFLKRLSLIELFIISLAFIFGSVPQSHYDAVHANLYNAKAYTISNSFAPLPESTPSLFPQNAIIYYQLFFMLGQERGLQFAFLLPLLLTFHCLQVLKINRLLTLPFLITPIILFQSSNGYYDLLVASILLLSTTIAITSPPKLSSLFQITTLIGFAAGAKYFALTLLPLPLFLIIKYYPGRNKIILLFLTLLLALTPTLIWSFRSYTITGSPTFPFFQELFPTPKYWPKNDVLENNPMIQSPITPIHWIQGQFILYPISTYFNTPQFLEAPTGYPTLSYILILPISLLIFFYLGLKFLHQQPFQLTDITYLCLSFAFFCTGIITRYYRYLWPFQFVTSIVSLLYLQKILTQHRRLKIVFSVLLFLVIPLNVHRIYQYFNPIHQSFPFFLQPDYFLNSRQQNNPISFINRYIGYSSTHQILDMSQPHLWRFHLTSRVTQCNWYWYDQLENAKLNQSNPIFGQQLLNQFDYIVTTNPPEKAKNRCLRFFFQNQSSYQLIYQDNLYQVYTSVK